MHRFHNAEIEKMTHQLALQIAQRCPQRPGRGDRCPVIAVPIDHVLQSLANLTTERCNFRDPLQ
jgi:hypothetical protein